MVIPVHVRSHLPARWIAAMAAFGLLLSASVLYALRGRYTVKEIAPHVFVWIPENISDYDGDPDFDVAANSGFIIGPEGVVVVNTTNTPFHAREVLYEIRERTELPVKYVIDTDARGDNTLGNEVFTDERATFISTPVVAAEMRDYDRDLMRRMGAEGEPGMRMRQRMRGIHFTLPTEQINNDMTLGVGGDEVRLLLPLAGPSPGSIVVFIPAAKVLFLGSLFENGHPPKLEGVDRKKWAAYLQQVETWDVNVYVPGHGAPGDKKSLQEFIQFLNSSGENPKPAPSDQQPPIPSHVAR